MKAKQGITLIILAVIIVIMTLLLTVVVVNGNGIYNATKKTKLQSEIEQIEILVDNYIRRNSGITFAAIQLDISSYTAEQQAQFTGENITDNILELYVVELDKIDAKEVAYGTGERGTTDRYLYSAVTNRVYYEQGIRIGGVIYHRIGKQEAN